MLQLLILLLFYSSAVQSTCPESSQVHCGSDDRCTRIRYICDGDNDCGDYSDEEEHLCQAWRNSDCERGQVLCHRRGSTDCVTIERFCQTGSPPCEGDLDRRLCQMLENEKLQALNDIVIPSGRGEAGGPDGASNLDLAVTKGEDFSEISQHTLKSDKCPLLYTRIGEECISLFFFGNATWGGARSFCQSIGGDLYVPETNENYHNLVHHMREHHLTSDFWVGGNHYNATVGWRWITDAPIELGTPHWAIRHNTVCTSRDVPIEHRNVTIQANDGMCYHYSQAPAAHPFGDCVAMTYDKFYFLSDEDCLMKKSPLCKLADTSLLQESA